MMMGAGEIRLWPELVVLFLEVYSNFFRHSYLNGIHHHGDIWKPDIYFIKHGTFKVNHHHSALLKIILIIFSPG